MEGENKRTKWLSLILIMVVITSVGFFMWNFIDRGTINFVGETPFIVEDHKGMRYECDQSPCEIKMRTGYKYLDFYKEDYDSFEETIKLAKKSIKQLTQIQQKAIGKQWPKF